jgi:hypothetical protein
MVQMARNLTDAGEPLLRHTRFLIMDRDTKYSAAFRAALTREKIEPIRLPPRSQNLNAYAGSSVGAWPRVALHIKRAAANTNIKRKTLPPLGCVGIQVEDSHRFSNEYCSRNRQRPLDCATNL